MPRGATLTILAALCLTGCGDRTKVASAPPVTPPPATSPGPVNPDPGVTRYVCADGQTVIAGYPDRETAIVSYRDHSYTLKLAGAADDARYTGYGLQWRIRGGRATLSELKTDEAAAQGEGLECRPVAPAGDSAPRTEGAAAK